VAGLVVAAIVVALGCAAACVARLRFATSPIAVHPRVWLTHVRAGEGDVARRVIERTPGATWERELLLALAEPNDEARAGRVNEQLGELDFRLGRWDRVPRVCASVASSAGFLLGSLVLRFGLLAASDAPDDLRGSAIDDVVLQAVNVAVFGVAGAAFAIATLYRARLAAKAFQRDADALVEALEHQA
jgi:hypothetical protein